MNLTVPIDRAQRRKAENGAKILSAAKQAFIRKGFAGTTISDIAEAADVAKGSVFTHAKNKERLLALVFEPLMHEWLDEASHAASRARGLVNKLDRFFSSIMKAMGVHPDLSAVFMRDLPYARSDSEMEAIEQRIDGLIGGLIDQAKARDELAPDVDTFVLGRNLFYTYYTAQYLWLAAGAPDSKNSVPTLKQQIAVQIQPYLRGKK